jgi:outer membrane protein TolC
MHRFQSLTKIAVSVLIVSICCQFGCRPQQPLYLGEKGLYQNHFTSKATQIEYPNVNSSSLPEVYNTVPPLTLDNPDPAAYWDLTLEESIQMALKNSNVIRTLTGVGFSQAGVSGTPGALLQSPGSVRTVYDPALIESDPRYGQEAALSAFDAQLTAGARWIKSDDPRRDGTGTIGSQSDQGVFNMGISKIAATGTQFNINHVNQYYVGGTPTTPSQWSSYLEGGFRHPLLRGSGIEFNRIAGPSGQVGVYGGVAIARINTDMSLNDFEMATRSLVADVEKAYWNLYFAWRRLDSVNAGRAAAPRTWHRIKTFSEVGATGGAAYMLAQAERNLFSFQQQVEVAQNNLFEADSALRYILGLAVSDGRLMRPVDEPITAPITLDWQNIVCEALFRSPELRKQKWAVKQRELELCASKSFLYPRLDLEANYRVAGAGKDLLGSDYSAYGSLTGGNYTGWTLGLTGTTSLGWRQEHAAVRNAQLSLAKAKTILDEQEVELTHQIGESFRKISLAYQQMQTTLSGFRAASDEVRAVQIAHEEGSATLDQVLQAQRQQAVSETDYHSSVIDYNLAIMMLHYRKGSLLEYNNVCLSEGPWPSKAYFDAKRRARERDAGHYFNYGYTLPGVVSRGTYQQHQHNYNSTAYEELPMTQSGGENNYFLPPAPPTLDGSPRMIETEPTSAIPTPILPKSGGNTPVSFTTPEVATPTLTPARNMRYVE